MKSFIILSAFALVGSCASTKYSTKIKNLKNSIAINDSIVIAKYANTITAEELKNNLYTFASKDFEGRKTGEEGQRKAARFLKTYYEKENIDRYNYFQTPTQ